MIPAIQKEIDLGSNNIDANVRSAYLTIIGAGTPAGTGVTCTDCYIGGVHRTIFTLTAFSQLLTLNGTTSAGAGTKIYDFPTGGIKVLGVTSNLTIANAGGNGSFLASLGSVTAATDGSLTSTEANICASTAATVASNIGTCKMLGDTVSVLDGTSSAIDMYFNCAINADGTGKNTMVFTGTITMYWLNLNQ